MSGIFTTKMRLWDKFAEIFPINGSTRNKRRIYTSAMCNTII